MVAVPGEIISLTSKKVYMQLTLKPKQNRKWVRRVSAHIRKVFATEEAIRRWGSRTLPRTGERLQGFLRKPTSAKPIPPYGTAASPGGRASALQRAPPSPICSSALGHRHSHAAALGAAGPGYLRAARRADTGRRGSRRPRRRPTSPRKCVPASALTTGPARR